MSSSFAWTVLACGQYLYGRQAPAKTAIINANVWNGSRYTKNGTVVIINGLISNANPAGATVYDAGGGYLLPGFLDTHCHVQACSDLNTLRSYGVTTALDMGTYPYSSIPACRASGLTDVYGPGAGATVNGSTFSTFPGFPADSFCPNITAGQQFVKDRLAQGVDYIKVLLDPTGPSNDTITAIVEAAHAADKLVISHAPTYADYSGAEIAGVDIPCHVPLDRVLDSSSISKLTANKVVVAPTLIMMQSIVNNTGQPYTHYTANAEGSVTAMYKAGIPIIAGSDANLSPYTPANPPFGLSLHEELQLLVQAGLTTVDAIKAATSLAASTFRLHDRGAISVGLRADLVLLTADPVVDIKNTLSLKTVWIEGVETDLS